MGILDGLRGNVLPLFTEVTRVSRYLVLPEFAGGVTVGGNQRSDSHVQFELPHIVAQVSAVLFFTAQPHAVDTTIQVRESQHGAGVLHRHTFTGGDAQSWHRVVPPLGLRATGNEIIFSVDQDGSGGSATFSDVVIMYTADKTTVSTPIEVVADPG